MSYTLASLRAQAITHSLFPAASLADAVARLGFVQIDPTRAPARAQDLTLRLRVAGYRAGDLEEQYPQLELAEDYLHTYGVLPLEVLSWMHPRQGDWRVEQEFPDLADDVLAFIREHGATNHRHLEKRFGQLRTTGDWGTRARAATRVMDMLHFRGWLRVAGRNGTLISYNAATPPESDLPPEERLHRLVLLLARLYMPINEATLREYVLRLRNSAPSLNGHRHAIPDLLKSGQLEQTVVEGVSYLWPAGEWIEQEAPAEVRWLGPFDPVASNRRRFEHLWGWPYRLEAYTPPAQRRFGHYALPVLWRDQMVGWVNLRLKVGKLDVDINFINGRPSDAGFESALEAEQARFSDFLCLGKA